MTSEEFKIKVLPWSRKLYPMIWRLLQNDAETEDAIQELMLKLWDKRKTLNKLDNFNGYILRMAKNHCLDVIKKKKPRYFGDEQQHKILNLPTDDKPFEHREKYEHVLKVIGALPEKYMQAIQYRDIDGLEFEEIKELTGYEVPYIRVLLSRARLMVRTEIQKTYSYEQRANT